MQIISQAVRWTSLISFPVFLLAVPNSFAFARGAGIGACADSLISSGVAELSAASACSDAIAPGDLASCVEQIEAETAVNGDEALQACYRVRRPEELADCVTTIDGSLETGKSAMALDSCQRSLLPERYAECALDLAGVSELPGEEVLKSCLAAEIKPGEVSPENSDAGAE
ncbi:MAG: hypothetical protein AAFV28_11080 [Cyanobacteria bacterium J06635_13]